MSNRHMERSRNIENSPCMRCGLKRTGWWSIQIALLPSLEYHHATQRVRKSRTTYRKRVGIAATIGDTLSLAAAFAHVIRVVVSVVVVSVVVVVVVVADGRRSPPPSRGLLAAAASAPAAAAAAAGPPQPRLPLYHHRCKGWQKWGVRFLKREIWKSLKLGVLFFFIFTIFFSENCKFELFFKLVWQNQQFYQGMCS